MIFRTELKGWTAETRLTHADVIFCMGSCFAAHIGTRLSERKFRTLTNPSGILYNPVSLGQTLGWIAEGHRFSESDIFERDGQWNSFYHHSRLSALGREELLANVNEAMDAAHAFFRDTTRALLTLGTAMVYEHRERGEVVANCHKLPAQAFHRRRLGVEEVVEALAGVFEKVKETKPALEVILTVSPVRHLREGMVENQRSKATLVLAAAHLADRLPYVHYFPAYELLLDDLRDYRFYGDDLVHPSPQAVEYIWEFFSRTYFPEATQRLIREVEEVLRAAQHRPFRPDSAAHQAFLRNQLDRIRTLQQAWPFLDFEEEKRLFGN